MSETTAIASGELTEPGRHQPLSSDTGPSNGTAERAAPRYREPTSVGDPVELHVETIGGPLDGQSRCGSQSFVFLHGLGGTFRYWTAAEGADLLPPHSHMVDLFGFGRSPRPLVRYTLERHLAALDEALGAKDPFVLVGHSLGAALAAAYAARHHDQIERLVLISLPAYKDRPTAAHWLRRRLRGWFFTNMVLSVIACVSIRRILGPVLPPIVRDVPKEVARDLVEHNFMSSTTSLWNVLYRHDIRTDIDLLPWELPVTLIHGTDDATAPIGLVRDIASEHESWHLIELDDVGHHPWLRQPEICAQAIRAGCDRAV